MFIPIYKVPDREEELLADTADNNADIAGLAGAVCGNHWIWSVYISVYLNLLPQNIHYSLTHLIDLLRFEMSSSI